jgi:hypothetical protein
MDLNHTDVVILRCCTDWPVHLHSAYGKMAKCSICGEVPAVVLELYPEEKYARNQAGYTPPPQV